MSGLYIHIPFCKQKCNYCDFHFSISLRNKEALIHAIKKELVLRRNEENEPIQTIYFGGGTPSILTIDELKGIFDSINSNYSVVKNVEITLETNPDDLAKSYLKELQELGINRLSIGVQSFFDADLHFMNRAHTSQEAIKAITDAQDSGIENITIDLIYGIPGLTKAKWQKNLNTFSALKIPHLSSYALTVEPKTVLAYQINTKKIKPLDDELARAHFEILTGFMKKNGYIHYELSNFAKEDFLSQHNTSYWQGKSYLGIGPSAHSYNQQTRSWNVANNTRYIKAIKEGELPNKIERLTTTMRYNEYIMTGLRTMWGINLDKIKQEFGEKYATSLSKNALKFLENGSLELVEKNSLKVVSGKFFLVDGLIADLFWLD